MYNIPLNFRSLLFISIFSLIASAQWVTTNGPSSQFISTLVANGNSLFAGTDSNGGIFLYNDVNNSWTVKNNGLPANTWVHVLSVNGADIYAGTHQKGVFISKDNGVTWSSINNGLPSVDSVSTSAPNSVYLFAFKGDTIFTGLFGGDIYRLINNDTAWTKVSNGLPWGLYFLAMCGSNLYAGSYFCNGIFYSINNGASWSDINTDFPLDKSYIGIWASVHCIVCMNNNIFVGTAESVFRLQSSWIAANTGLPTTSMEIACLAANRSDLFAGQYYGSGVFFSSNNGASWSDISDGLGTTPIMSLAVCNNYLYAGTFKCGVWKRPLSEIVSTINSKKSSSKLESELESDISIIKNGSNILFKFSNSMSSNINICIYSATGKLVFKDHTDLIKYGENNFILNKLHSGIYFYRFYNERIIKSGHFIINDN